jgi:hypothetical protein
MATAEMERERPLCAGDVVQVFGQRAALVQAIEHELTPNGNENWLVRFLDEEDQADQFYWVSTRDRMEG